MRLVQFQVPGWGRRVGLVKGDMVLDLTELEPTWTMVYNVFQAARGQGLTLDAAVERALEGRQPAQFSYKTLWEAYPGDVGGWLLPPLDHPDPAHCFIGGTGLTHLGSTQARGQMHRGGDDSQAQGVPPAKPQTDSEKMFAMGLRGGKPAPGQRGIAPECFYKGSGVILRGHHEFLDIPPYAQDGGEEPEIVGCYIIGSDGVPYRLGFALGNEWSDHAMERVNYLWLAPSKLRTCAIGPELVTDEPFQDLRGRCRILRRREVLYDSGELLTGEANMSHSLANLEDHHFKHAQFRVAGDVHLYFFGTMKLSFGSRGPFEEGDVIEIDFPRMGRPLVNRVRRLVADDVPVQVRRA
ncbi:MAG: sugar transporter [Chloroflexi bacterium]|nr:sugar transporter [Chloroflexota bacterium]